MQFLFVRPRFCPWVITVPHIRLPSDSTSRWTPLSSANSSYCQACSGLSPPSNRSCRAHNINCPPTKLILEGGQTNTYLQKLVDSKCYFKSCTIQICDIVCVNICIVSIVVDIYVKNNGCGVSQCCC